MNVAPIVQVFQPSRNEFQDFNNYIEYMESKGADEAGLIKVSIHISFLNIRNV